MNKTMKEFNNIGYYVRKGSKPVGFKNGEALFTWEQVYMETTSCGEVPETISAPVTIMTKGGKIQTFDFDFINN